MSKPSRYEREIREALSSFHPEPIGAYARSKALTEARETLSLYREAQGFMRSGSVVLLTQPEGNVKLEKSERPSYSLSLSPATSGGWNVCVASTRECRRHCVAHSGKGSLSSVIRGRAWKTDALLSDSVAFIICLVAEIDAAVSIHGEIAVRLNAFSDLLWELLAPWLFDRYGDAVVFYDYTKREGRDVPPSYHLTLSASERTSEADVSGWSENAAVIFDVQRGRPLPATYAGRPVIDGDLSDFRPGDPEGVIVGLRAKGSLRNPETVGDSSFVKG